MNESAKEVVYVNGGELYKAPTNSQLGLQYVFDDAADPIFPFTKADGKRYIFTTEFKQFFNGEAGVSLQNYDLCPAVDLWICLAATSSDETQNYDLYFAANSSVQLQEIADYYGLPYPINSEIAQVIFEKPQDYLFWNAGGRPIIPGGIKFINGQPAIFKLYTYPKPAGEWDIWMYGASYCDGGQTFEKGAVYERQTGGLVVPGALMRGKNSFMKAERIQSKLADGTGVSYRYVDNGDPVMFWEARVGNQTSITARTKKYESANWVRKAIARLNTGWDLSGFDRCPEIQYWLGRATYDQGDEQEVFFAVTEGSATLDAAAAFYNLPIPYSPKQKAILDTSPEKYRARHYDLLGQGVGNYINVVVGSITFIGGLPTRLLLYTFLRPWDFEDGVQLEML